MTYISPAQASNIKQYVVIAAGEYGFMNTIMGDHVVSYSPKGAGE